MTVGTKSLLYGVHAFWYHPILVSLAWRRRYRRWPTFYQFIAIFFHDWGYFGKENLDGESGKHHPMLGANITRMLIQFFETLRGNSEGLTAWNHYILVLGHSRSMAEIAGIKTSLLCNPDKESILFEPRWFYLLRATLSGEINEYRSAAIRADKISPFATNRQWFDWFKKRVAERAALRSNNFVLLYKKS